MKWLKYVIAALALFALIGWRISVVLTNNAKLKSQSEQRKKAAQNVEFTTATPATLDFTVDSVGSLESPFTVKLSAKTSGVINFLNVREGDDVKPGQVLVKIDPSDLVGQVLQQQSSVAESKARLAQASITQGANDTSVWAQVNQQQASVDSAQADYAQVTENYASLAASADALVADADAKVSSATSQVESAKADLASSTANFENAKARLARIESLFKQQFVAAQDVDDARAAMKVQQAAMNVSEKKLESAQAALVSAKAQRQSVARQAAISKRKGLADIEASKAKLTQARASFKVAKANTAQKSAYQENLTALKAGVNASLAQLAQAKSKLSDTSLKSTIEGTITARNMDPGTLVTPGQQILTVQYLNWLYVSCSVPIEDSPKLRKGQKASVVIDALPNQTFEGTVDSVNMAADPLSRQFTLRIKLDNAQRILRPGMYARVSIVIGKVEARVVIPREAITRADKKVTVTTVDDSGVAKIKEVTLGATNGKLYEVKSGLEPGEKVVTLSYSKIKDGQKINIKQPGKEKSQSERGTK